MKLNYLLLIISICIIDLSANDVYKFSVSNDFDASLENSFIDNNQYFATPDNNLFQIEVLDVKYNPVESIAPIFSEMPGLWYTDAVYHLHKQGIKRHLELARVEFPLFKSGQSGDSILTECTYKINYGMDLPKKEAKLNKYQLGAFAEIENLDNLPRLIAFVDSKHNDVKLSNENWIDPNLEYLKINTKEDGIASISTDKIISNMPNWEGLPVSEFQLLHKGIKYPVHFNSSSMTKGDFVYFQSSRAYGDTTWFDNYAGEEPYFLVRNTNDTPELYNKLLFASNPSTIIDKVKIKSHIEKEKEYSFGDTVYSHYTLPFEGWYWHIFDKYGKPGNIDLKRFKYNLVITPADDPLYLKIRYNTQLNYDASRSDFGISLRLNNQVHDSVYVQALGEGFLENSSTYRLTPGATTIEVRAIGIMDDIGRVGIDYMELSGNVKPFAYEGKAEFSITNQASDFSLSVPGFSSEDIFIIDTISGSIATVKGISGTSFRVSAQNDQVTHASIVINDSIYTSEEAGVHIVTMDDNANWEKSFYTPGIEEAASVIASIQSKSFAICINKFPVADKIKNALQSLGASTIPSASNKTYIFYGKKGIGVLEKESDLSVSDSKFLPHTTGLSFQADLNLKANKDYHLIMTDKVHSDKGILYNVEKPDILAKDKDYKAIVLTHADLLPSAIAYKEYRANQNIDVKIVDVNNIYNRYNYGKKSPHAIKEYLRDIYTSWESPLPTHIVIIGDASWDNRDVMGLNKVRDFVPAYGWPVTDYWYVVLDSPEDQVGDFAIGRIPVNDNQEMLNYIQKIMSYENASKAPWMKRFLHLSGGDGKNEIDYVFSKSIMHGILLHQEPICADTTHIIKPAGDIVSEAVASKIKNEINNGVNFVTFFGHGSPEVFDIEGWQVEKLSNQDRYFGLLTLACNAGAFAEPSLIKCRNESYVTAQNKGAIVAIGGSGVGIMINVDKWAKRQWEGLIRSNTNIRNFGELVAYPKATLDLIPKYIGLRFQTNLLGDPLVDMRLGKNPDPYLSNNYVNIENENGTREFTDENNYLVVSGEIYNYGIAYLDSVKLRLTYVYEGVQETEDIQYLSILNSKDFSFKIPIKDKPGKYNIKVEVDPERLIDKDDVSNNILTFDVNVFKRGLLPLEPLSYWNINPDNPKFRFINPLKGDFTYKFVVSENRGDTINTLASSLSEEIEEKENFILWNSNVSLTKSSNYWIGAKPISDNSDNPEADWLWIPAHAQTVHANVANFSKKANNLGAHYFKNIEYLNDNNNSRVQLEDKKSDFYIVSVKGYNVDGVNNRWVTLTVDNQTYIDIWSARGFNVVTYPKYVDDGKPRYKRFDCYRPDVNSDENLENVYALHSFLRDSVRDDEYLAIATCDNSLAWQEYLQQHKPDDSGSLDSLKELLKMYGAHLVDSLHSQTSYALFSWKGASESEAVESINMDRDTAMIQGNIQLYRNSGTFNSERIGPAQKWNKLLINSQDNEHSDVNIILYDTLNTSSIYGEYPLNKEINISDINPVLYPYISYEVNLKRNDTKENPIVTDIELEYSPSPELAVINSTFELDELEVMRGYPNSSRITVENISGRSSISESEVSVGIYKNQSIAEQSFEKLNKMSVDASKSIEKIFETEALTVNNEIQIEANPYKKFFTELYSFNNAAAKEFHIVEDSLRPSAIILADENVIGNYSYVSANPLFELRVFDNSPLEFSEGIEPSIRLNGKFYTEDNAQFYNLEFVKDSEDNLKAILQVRPDTISYEESLLIAYMMDATGNRDTVEYFLNTINQSKIQAAAASPNPFTDKTELTFDLLAAFSDGYAEIIIFNAEGMKVKRLRLDNLKVGKNSVEWDGTDNNGLYLPSGAYFFSVFRKSDYYTEESYGKVILVK